jgi:sugar lactone lactonase YvrE
MIQSKHWQIWPDIRAGERLLKLKFAIAACAISCLGTAVWAQGVQPDLSVPSPFEMPQYNWAHTADGKPWGSTSGVDVDAKGNVWMIGRCGANNCDGSNVGPVYEMDMKTGKPIKSIGAGLFVFPHGLALDKQGNIYVSDAQTSKDGTKGQTVTKMDPNGKVLMVLGTPGKAGGGPDHLNEPCDIAIAPNGDIFVADGHSGGPNSKPDYVTRIVHFSKTGKFIKAWGSMGTGPGQFRAPHALAFDTEGRLFVADRGNNRVQIFTQAGKYVTEYKSFGRPVGLWVDKKDTLYVTDADSNAQLNPGWPKGIWIGSAKTGKVTGFVFDPYAGEGVLVAPDGNMYAAVNVPPHGITKYASPSSYPASTPSTAKPKS